MATLSIDEQLFSFLMSYLFLSVKDCKINFCRFTSLDPPPSNSTYTGCLEMSLPFFFIFLLNLSSYPLTDAAICCILLKITSVLKLSWLTCIKRLCLSLFLTTSNVILKSCVTISRESSESSFISLTNSSYSVLLMSIETPIYPVFCLFSYLSFLFSFCKSEN